MNIIAISPEQAAYISTADVTIIPPTPDNLLSAMIDKVYKDLVAVVDLSTAYRLSQESKVLLALVQNAHAALEIKVQAAELVLRCERATALAMVNAPKSKGSHPVLSGRKVVQSNNYEEPSSGYTVDPLDNNPKTLSEIGISKHRAHSLRQLAKVDEDKFEALIEQGKDETLTRRDERCTGLSVKAVLAEVRDDDRFGKEAEFSAIIKPMDNWNFSPVFYEKVRIEGNGDGAESHGYIPGEVYANVLWYYAKPGDVVVEPMAGSGLIWKVWEDRQRWLKGWPGLDPDSFSNDDEPLTIRTFDLNPRGPYAHLIEQHDLSAGFPIDHADYIFMDVPYFAIVNGQYSTKGQDLANMDQGQWEQAMEAVARSCSSGQSPGKLCSVMVPNWRDLDSGKIVLAPRIVQRVFEANGYTLHDVVYSSRRIQQQQNFGMAMANNKAKRSRVMLTDIAEILTFRRN